MSIERQEIVPAKSTKSVKFLITATAEVFYCRYTADSIILGEIPNSHPYLTGLGIFGGLATFSNPLQGVILGPMALTVLSVLYNLRYSVQAYPYGLAQ